MDWPSGYLLVNVAEMNLFLFKRPGHKGPHGFEPLSARVGVPPGSERIQHLGGKAACLHSGEEQRQAVPGRTELRSKTDIAAA